MTGRKICAILLFWLTAQGALFSQAVNSTVVFQNRLSIPPLLDPAVENGERVYSLTLQKGEKQFLPGKSTPTYGINGPYLGPTLRIHSGDRVHMRVTNEIGTETTIHWHGMELPALMDGVYQVIQPTGTWEPYWTVRNQAATLWYHAHLMGRTGEQVYKGLAGMIIVDDANSDSLALPHRYGVDDLPVIVQDKKFDADGQLVYEHHSEPVAGPQGFLGDTILVNGTLAPFVEAPRGWLRLRLLNASNGRRFNFGFDKANTLTPATGFLSRTSFGVYSFHAPILVAISLGLRALVLYPIAKAVLAAAIALAASLAFSAVVRRVPGLGRVFS